VRADFLEKSLTLKITLAKLKGANSNKSEGERGEKVKFHSQDGSSQNKSILLFADIWVTLFPV